MLPPTDKNTTGLTRVYAQLFRDWREKPVRVLEIGIFQGGSMWYWAEIFPHPETLIVGIDLQIPQIAFPKNVRVHACDQNDPEALRRMASQYGPFDLIVDDGCHFATETRLCFSTLFPSVKVGGSYVIEDWAVGYWRDRDPRYHGMVEVVTDIVRDAPAKSIEGFFISLNSGQAYAAFRKGAEGWRH
jgi:cephalosporin hydroxylase